MLPRGPQALKACLLHLPLTFPLPQRAWGSSRSPSVWQHPKDWVPKFAHSCTKAISRDCPGAVGVGAGVFPVPKCDLFFKLSASVFHTLLELPQFPLLHSSGAPCSLEGLRGTPPISGVGNPSIRPPDGLHITPPLPLCISQL